MKQKDVAEILGATKGALNQDLIRFSERCETCTWKHTVAVNMAMTKERVINSGSYDLVRIIKMDI